MCSQLLREGYECRKQDETQSEYFDVAKFHCMYPYFIDIPLRPHIVYKVQRKNPKQLKSTSL